MLWLVLGALRTSTGTLLRRTRFSGGILGLILGALRTSAGTLLRRDRFSGGILGLVLGALRTSAGTLLRRDRVCGGVADDLDDLAFECGRGCVKRKSIEGNFVDEI